MSFQCVASWDSWVEQMQEVSPERRAGLGGRAPLPHSDALDEGDGELR